MKVYNLFLKLYIVLTLLLFAFVNIESSTIFEGYRVFFLSAKVIKIHFYLSLFMLGLCLMIKIINKVNIKFDIISTALVFKVVFDLIPLGLFSIDIGSYTEYWIISISCFIVYFLIINSKISYSDLKFYKIIIILFAIIISAQIFETSYSILSENRNFYLYKNALNIPYGGSNIISSILCPVIAFVFFGVKNKILKFSLILLFFIAICFTFSRGGMLLSSSSLLLFLFISGRKKISFKKIVITVFSVAFVVLFLVYIVPIFDFSYTAMSSSRLDIIKNALENYKVEYFVFGAGMKPVLGGNDAGLHNFIIDLFIRCGIIGVLLYLIIFYCFFKAKKDIKSNLVLSFYFPVLIIFVNSIFEVCYFSYKCDVLLWMFIGFFMLICKVLKEEKGHELYSYNNYSYKK